MKKTAIILGLFGVALVAQAAITVGTAPTSLVTSVTTLAASTEKAVFEFALTASAAETLSSVTVTVNSSTAIESDLDAVTVYKDDGSGIFNGADLVAGTNATVNVGSTTTVATASNNTLTGGKFFVVLKTDAAWAGTDSVTVTLNTNGLTTSANSPSTNSATTSAISATSLTGPGTGDDEFGHTCTSGIKNGKIYKVSGSETVYLAAGCKLKPFRGAAVFHARGHKFQDIITLSSLNGITVSDKPALPAGGTLVKGSHTTVWFVTEDGKIKGFTSEFAFRRLGFDFKSVKEISDSDLSELITDTSIGENSAHPDGAVLKCTTSSTVYMMKGNKKLAFTNPEPYLERGHTWDAIAVVNCRQFTYEQGANVTQ